MTRRTVLQILAGLIHAAIAVALSIPVIRFLAFPFAQARISRIHSRRAAFRAVTGFAHPACGQCRARGWIPAFSRGGDRTGLAGSTRINAESTTVRCLQTICPHLGCAIDLNPARTGFSCPCHTSDFARDGTRKTGPSPRDMDELECRLSDPDASGERWVEIRYQEFKTGTTRREPLA